MNQRKDVALLKQAKAGVPDALDELVRLYWRGAYNCALHVLRCHEDAEDIAQEALSSAIRHLCSFDERASFSTWLHRIVLNSSMMLLRHRRCSTLDRACPYDEQIHGSRPFQMQRNAESEAIKAEGLRLLSAAVEALPRDYSLPLSLYTYQQKSIVEIAQQLKLSPNGVKIRLHRARKVLYRRTARASRLMTTPVATAA